MHAYAISCSEISQKRISPTDEQIGNMRWLFLVFDPFPDGRIHPSGDVQSHCISLRIFWQFARLLKFPCSREQEYLNSQWPSRDAKLLTTEARDSWGKSATTWAISALTLIVPKLQFFSTKGYSNQKTIAKSLKLINQLLFNLLKLK